MDIKDIIKWFIPCFLVIFLNPNVQKQKLKSKFSLKATVFCLFLFFNGGMAMETNDNGVFNSVIVDSVGYLIDRLTKEIVSSTDSFVMYNKTGVFSENSKNISENYVNNEEETGISIGGRTFGRPMKKMAMAMIPLVFQIGAASTWAVVSALVSLKALAVGLLILKLLLVAGAAKIGALFGHKVEHQQPSWTPQKEVHVHIHNSAHGHESAHEEYPPWSRDGATGLSLPGGSAPAIVDPYAGQSGPQTISTPYGQYVRIGPSSKS